MQPTNTNIKTPKQALNLAFLKQRPEKGEIELFKKELITLLIPKSNFLLKLNFRFLGICPYRLICIILEDAIKNISTSNHTHILSFIE